VGTDEKQKETVRTARGDSSWQFLTFASDLKQLYTESRRIEQESIPL
jgi:hypothetical protein